jgi:hypothetical protein
MSQQFFLPFAQNFDSTPAAYNGGKLYFYATGSSTPQPVYSDEALGSAITQPVTLNSAGRPSTQVFLQNLPYKVVLTDANDAVIWTADPVYTTDFKSVCITKVISGSPNGQLAGTAGSSGVLPTLAWDFLNQQLYACTTTGTSSTAVWTAINTSAVTPPSPQPQGYLTPTSGTAVIVGDVASATAVYYTPFVGRLIPIYNSSQFIPTTFSELTLTLHSSHAANTIYDVFVISDSGTLRLVTGPAWSVSTAGSGARGTGAGTTELTRLNGFWVNSASMTARNGSSTYSVGANLATFVGSLFIDGTQGQVTCHSTYGQSRKWGVWNAYNRQPLLLQCGDTTANWTYNTATVRQSNGAAGNKLTVFAGLAETRFFIDAVQSVSLTTSVSTSVSAGATIGIGVNSTTAYSGKRGVANSGGTTGPQPDMVAKHVVLPTIGIQDINFLESGNGTTNAVFQGGNDDMIMTATWLG